MFLLKSRNIILLSFFLFAFGIQVAFAQISIPVYQTAMIKKFEAGVNLSLYENYWKKADTRLTENVLEKLEIAYKIGFKTIRLPVDFDSFLGEGSNTINVKLLQKLSLIYDYLSSKKMNLIIVYHYGKLYKNVDFNKESLRIADMWLQVLNHFKGKGYNNLFFGLYNEPRVPGEVWAFVDELMMKAVRPIDKDRYWMIGSTDYNGIDAFAGAEYEKNDIKQHEKINEEKGYQYFKTAKFQAFADRILRYELTIRNNYLNYLHKHNIFRKDCPLFKKGLAAYMKVESANQKNDRISKIIGKLSSVEKIKYSLLNPYEKIDRWERSVHKEMMKLYTRRRYFTMEIDPLSELYNIKTIEQGSDKALFSDGLLTLCLNRLVEFINEFQIYELPDEERVKCLIDSYNSIHRVKLPRTEMIQFYEHLMKYGSFKDTFKLFQTPKTSRYRYTGRFKKIGITENSIKPIDSMFSIPKTTLDFKEYHSFLFYDDSLTRGIRIN